MKKQRELTDNEFHRQRRGMRWGRVLMALEVAKKALDFADSEHDLFSKDMRHRIHRAKVEVGALEQEAWIAEDKEVVGWDSKKRRKKR